MQILHAKSFIRQYKKKDAFIKDRFIERQKLFVINRFYPILNNHSLSGEWLGHNSINITGDIRAVFKEIDESTVMFVAIGTHAELYS